LKSAIILPLAEFMRVNDAVHGIIGDVASVFG
jgi:hypothetical protein